MITGYDDFFLVIGGNFFRKLSNIHMQARIKKFSLFAFLDFIWYFKEALQFSKVQLVASATTI